MNDVARRTVLAQGVAAVALGTLSRAVLSAERIARTSAPEKRWYDAAAAMQRQALSSGDQPYGAVLVLDGALVGNGPSRVVALADPTAHAEREAIRDARRRLGRASLAGSILYSTSRPCRACETAAAEAGVARMIHGPDLSDAGRPTP